MTPDLEVLRVTLVREFPYAVAAIERLPSDLVGRSHTLLPTLPVGLPGAGKSRLAELLGLGSRRLGPAPDECRARASADGDGQIWQRP